MSDAMISRSFELYVPSFRFHISGFLGKKTFADTYLNNQFKKYAISSLAPKRDLDSADKKFKMPSFLDGFICILQTNISVTKVYLICLLSSFWKLISVLISEFYS